MITLKLSKTDAERFGLASADDAKALLEIGLEAQSGDKDKQISTLQSRITELEEAANTTPEPTRFSDQDVADLAAKLIKDQGLVTVNGVGASKIIDSAVEKARDIIGKETMKSIAQVGSNALIHRTGEDVTDLKPAAKSTDPKAKWESDENLRNEFPSFEAYAGWCRVEASGMAKISSRN